MFILNLFYLLIPATIFLAFMWAPAAMDLGEASRILYFHVPLAWTSTLAFMICGIFSIVYLLDKEKKFRLIEEKTYNSAVIGMIFMVLTTVTGSIWSRISWGAFWNWDPRQTSIIVLMLIYLAYFSLRTALAENPARGKLTSSYLIIAMLAAPFFIFVIPRLYPSLHPDPILNPDKKVNLDERMRITFIIASISFSFLYLYLFSISNRISKISRKIEENCRDRNNED